MAIAQHCPTCRDQAKNTHTNMRTRTGWRTGEADDQEAHAGAAARTAPTPAFYLECIKSAVKYWLANDFLDPNWWWNVRHGTIPPACCQIEDSDGVQLAATAPPLNASFFFSGLVVGHFINADVRNSDRTLEYQCLQHHYDSPL